MKTYLNVVYGKYEKQIPVDDMCISLLSTHNRQKNPVRSSQKDTIVSHTHLCRQKSVQSFVELLKNLWTRSDVHASY